MIDLRPLQAENGVHPDIVFYFQNFVEALCRGARSETFFLWTNSSAHLAKDFPRWRYPNVRYIHTDESNTLINLCTSFFRFPYLDDVVETEAMRQGLLPWTQKIDLSLFLAPCSAPVEKNGKKAFFVYDLLSVHFPEFLLSLKGSKKIDLSGLKKDLQESHLIFTPSVFNKNDIVRTFQVDESKISVVGGATAFPIHRIEDDEILQAVRTKYALPEKFFLYVGSAEKQKNLPLLLKAYSLHRSRNGHKSWDLVLAGDSRHQALYGERMGVYAVGAIENEDISALYSLAQAFVYPSLFEGFGVRVLESLSAGCPVIFSQFSSIPEIAQDVGIMVDPSSANAVFRAMQKIFSSPELQEHLRIDGIQRAQEEKFKWETVASIFMEKVYSLFEE